MVQFDAIQVGLVAFFMAFLYLKIRRSKYECAVRSIEEERERIERISQLVFGIQNDPPMKPPTRHCSYCGNAWEESHPSCRSCGSAKPTP